MGQRGGADNGVAPPRTALTVGSLFSGVGGIDLAFERAGTRVIWNCEIDAKCRSVLRRHWPGVPRFKDVRMVTGDRLRAAGLVPDALVGGFPCTDVSVAGRRAGLAGAESGLFFEFARIAEETKPQWLLIENVPGLLSSNRGRDMGTVIGTLADIGYVGAWRVLDAQFFGVAQRRRRVFIVGHLGDGRRAAEVLLEPEGGGGDPPARRAEGPVAAPGAGGCLAGDGDIVTGLTGGFGNGGADDNKAQAGWLVPAVSNALCSTRGQRNDHNEQTFLPVPFRKATKIHGPLAMAPDAERWEPTDVTDTFTERDGTASTIAIVQPVAYGLKEANRQANGWGIDEERAYTLDGQGRGSVAQPVAPTAFIPGQLAVRRLTPLECLRLQGLPDWWLDDLGLADSTKYRQIGNAVAVPCVEWIARRIIGSSGHSR